MNLTLGRAGRGAAGTILDGRGAVNGNPVVGITDVTTAELRDLLIIGDEREYFRDWGVGAVRTGFTLNRVTLTANTTRQK